MKQRIEGVSQIQWLPVYNASGETIPAFAAMRISGIQATTFEFTVAKPNANDAVNNILFNGPCEIAAAHYGMGTADMPACVRYDTGDGTPVNGDEWGVSSGDWKLRNARSGFLIQGTTDTTTGIAVAVRNTATSSGATSVELKGLTFTSDTDSTADSDPGNGLFKWNNATQSSATVLYFDNQTADGISVATLWASLAGTGEGFIFLQQADDSTKWQSWKWSNVVNGTGYYKFTVALQANGGSIADAKTVYCTFSGSPDASGTVSGIVNTTTQTFEGQKTFDDRIVATDDIMIGGQGLFFSTGDGKLGFADTNGTDPQYLSLRYGSKLSIFDESDANEWYLTNVSGALSLAGGGGVGSEFSIGSALLIIINHTPASASASGNTGTIAWDSNYIYICTATNTWKRVAIATW